MTSDCIGKAGTWTGRPALTGFADLWRAAMQWRSRRQTKCALSGMSDQMLRDIGMRRTDVELTVFGQAYPQRSCRNF